MYIPIIYTIKKTHSDDHELNETTELKIKISCAPNNDYNKKIKLNPENISSTTIIELETSNPIEIPNFFYLFRYNLLSPT